MVASTARWRCRASRGVALGILLGLSAACGQTAQGNLPRGTLLLGPSHVALHVEIAETEAARERGLMNRIKLAADAGMAFLFGSPVRASFFMKDTLIPLSIAFWDQSSHIVAILDMTPCRTDPCPTYSPGRPYVGAVEANQGYFVDHLIRIGDEVELER